MLIKTLTFFLTRMWKKTLFIISAVVKPAYLSWNNQFWRKSFLCIIIHQGFSRISGIKIFHTKRVFEYAYAKLICQSKTTKLSFLFFLYQFSGWLYISFLFLINSQNFTYVLTFTAEYHLFTYFDRTPVYMHELLII